MFAQALGRSFPTGFLENGNAASTIPVSASATDSWSGLTPQQKEAMLLALPGNGAVMGKKKIPAPPKPSQLNMGEILNPNFSDDLLDTYAAANQTIIEKNKPKKTSKNPPKKAAENPPKKTAENSQKFQQLLRRLSE